MLLATEIFSTDLLCLVMRLHSLYVAYCPVRDLQCSVLGLISVRERKESVNVCVCVYI